MMPSGAGLVRRFLFYSIFEGGFEIRKFKLITRLLKPFRLNTRAVEKQRIAHFAKDETNGKFWKRQERRAIKNLTEGLGKFLVRHWIWACHIHGAAKVFILEREVYDADNIVE